MDERSEPAPDLIRGREDEPDHQEPAPAEAGDATVRRYHYDSHDQLRRHLAEFVAAYNFARRLKTLRGLTPSEFICKAWTQEPERFTLNPLHQTPGPNILGPRLLA
jgi:transposase InsO family protein